MIKAGTQMLRQGLRRTGFDVVRWVPEVNQPFPVLPMLVRQHLALGGGFFFVQVGANDGILDDPIRDLVIAHRLPGLLIEPLPDLFEKLQANYAGQDQLRFENSAVLAQQGEVTIHRVRTDASVAEHWHGIASFSRANLLKQGVPATHIDACTVKGFPIQTILKRHDVQRISLLQVDTEGYDYEVIRSTFGAGLLPDIINYEHCWLPPKVRHACQAELVARGYQFIEAGKDTVAIRGQHALAASLR